MLFCVDRQPHSLANGENDARRHASLSLNVRRSVIERHASSAGAAFQTWYLAPRPSV